MISGPLQEVRLLLNAQKEPKGCAFVEYKTSAAMLVCSGEPIPKQLKTPSDMANGINSVDLFSF